jgi:hypothetical protein
VSRKALRDSEGPIIAPCRLWSNPRGALAAAIMSQGLYGESSDMVFTFSLYISRVQGRMDGLHTGRTARPGDADRRSRIVQQAADGVGYGLPGLWPGARPPLLQRTPEAFDGVACRTVGWRRSRRPMGRSPPPCGRMTCPRVQHQHGAERAQGLREVVPPAWEHGAVQQGTRPQTAIVGHGFDRPAESDLVTARPPHPGRAAGAAS